jgi:hypothetical protein
MSAYTDAESSVLVRAALCAVLGMLVSACEGRAKRTLPQGDIGNAAAHVRTYGEGGLQDRFDAIRTTSAGGYVVVGTGQVFDNGTGTGHLIWAIKTNADGSVAWQYRFTRLLNAAAGDFAEATAHDLQLTNDGGCVIAGSVDDDATVIKLNSDGSIAWQWALDTKPSFEGDPRLRRSAAFAIDITPDGSLLVAGGVGSFTFGVGTSLADGDAWVVKLDADGKERAGFDAFTGARIFSGGQANAILAVDDDGFVVAGRSFGGPSTAGVAVKWAARVRPGFFTIWKKSYDAGEFRAIRRIDHGFVLAGLSPRGPAVYELADDGSLASAREYRAPDGGETGFRVREANAIQLTSDGGYLLAGTYDDLAWLSKVDRASGAIRWQNTYVGPGPRLIGGGEMASIDSGTASGYRAAGRLDSYAVELGSSGSGNAEFNRNYGWALDVRDDGSIDVSPVSRVSVVPTRVAPADVTSTVSVVAYGTEFENLHDSRTNELSVAAQATVALIETMSAPSGVLAAPGIGSNSPTHSFYWTAVPEASGFILFHSADGVAFERDSSWFISGFDFDHYRDGFYRLVAFNAAGYSDFSGVAQLGSEPPIVPGVATLVVVRAGGGDGLVDSTPAGITCGTDCSEDYSTASGGTQVTLRARDGELVRFSSWTGCDSTTDTQCTVLIDRNRTVGANFVRPPP